MSSELWAAAVGGGAGLATGAVSSLLAPWAKWSTEKRQIKMQHRYALLARWREGVANYSSRSFSLPSTSWYQQLRSHLSFHAIATVEAPRVPIATDLERSERRQTVAVTLAEKIDRIERKWKLN